MISVDALRGGAALAVVVYHSLLHGEWRQFDELWFRVLSSVVSWGHLGVPMFFVLSGFCIHQRWLREASISGDSAKIRPGEFWRRRLWRLYPPYFAALVASMALVLAAYFLGVEAAHMEKYSERGLWAIGEDFFFHATMLHGLHPLFDSGAGNAPFWTLAREEYLYLLYLPALWVRRTQGLWVTTLGVLGVSLFSAWVAVEFLSGSIWFGVVSTSAFSLWMQWWLGVVAAEAHAGRVRIPRVFFSVWAVPCFFGAALYLDGVSKVMGPLAWGMTFFVVLNVALKLGPQERAEPSSAWRRAAQFGAVSYSVYLVHDPIRAVMARGLRVLWVADNPYLYVLNCALVSIAGIVIGISFFWLVERHFLSDSKGAPFRTEKSSDASVGVVGL